MIYYIGTFGVGHELHDKVQPIFAGSKEQAENLMATRHGKEWTFMYSPEDFVQAKLKGYFRNVKTLPVIENKEAI